VIPEVDAARLLRRRFGGGASDVVSRAPGRVNLIGEHTDYNEGYVLPFAVDRYTEVALRRRRDMAVHVYTAVMDATFSTRLPVVDAQPRGDWSDYVVGVLRELAALAPLPFGVDAVIESDVPLGAGLSSSASLEVACAVGLARLYGLAIEDLDLVTLCQRAEADFVGMPCGIMDQYAAYFGEPGKVLLLDTRVLEHRAVPLDLKGLSLLIVDSKVRRALATSGYATRRRECEDAARWLAERFPEKGIRALRDVDQEMLAEVREEMPEILWRRASHVVDENARVLAMVEALESSDFRAVGDLLCASHVSLRDLFQVSVPELDSLVEWGLDNGALGARLVGGGFGGVTLHLVPEERTERYAREAKWAYQERFGIEAEAIEVRPGSGAKRDRDPEHR
jgi:galactokinase